MQGMRPGVVTTMPTDYAATATWEGAPRVGDMPVSLDRFQFVLTWPDGTPIDRHTAYTWSARGVLPDHDGVNGRSRYWWESKLQEWWRQRHPELAEAA